MEFISNFYDNFLIYYPNVFFVVIFFISILGIILINIGVFFLWKKVRRAIKKIKSSLRQKEIIKRNKKRKISFFQIIKARVLIIFFVQMMRGFFIRINVILEYMELQVKKIVKKIEKEIFIKE